MMINEKDIDRIRQELSEKGYTGKFSASYVSDADPGVCMRKYVDYHIGQGWSNSVFPITLFNVIDGDKSTGNFILVAFKFDSGLHGRLHLAGMEAYKSMGNDPFLFNANEELNKLVEIPAKEKVMAMEFQRQECLLSNSTIDIPKHPCTAIAEIHLDEFVKAIKEKGYTGKFSSPESDNIDLVDILGLHITHWSYIGRPAPIWISTITAGKARGLKYTLCKMCVQFDQKDGLRIDQITPTRVDKTLKKKAIHVRETILVSSLKDLPDRASINNYALKKNKLDTGKKKNISIK